MSDDLHEEFDQEELFDSRRAQRKERKRASSRDRSFTKKSDWEKSVPSFTPEEWKEKGYLRGRVITMRSQGIEVALPHKTLLCQVRGTLKQERRLHKNLLVIGDWVWVEPIDELEGAIAVVEPRTTWLSRADTLSRRKQHLLAANIDLALITLSVVSPPLKPPLIDRYIIAAKKGGMRPLILINKVDLLPQHPEEEKLLEESERAYAKAAVPLFRLSIHQPETVEALRKVLEGHASVFSGPSGVGKTSLINALTGRDLPTREEVAKTKKGTHTTTAAKLLSLGGEGWCVDTPGIKSFGLWDVTEKEIKKYFSEIAEVGVGCAFRDCSHRHEKGCRVLEELERGEISQLRYDSYVQLLESCGEKHYRR